MIRKAEVHLLGANSILILVEIYIDGVVVKTIKRTYSKIDIVEVEYTPGTDYISVMMRDAKSTNNWLLTTNQYETNTDIVIVTKFKGSDVTTNDALFNDVSLLRD